jgi:putative spermidine/putrescine transport system ATP-binding protein
VNSLPGVIQSGMRVGVAGQSLPIEGWAPPPDVAVIVWIEPAAVRVSAHPDGPATILASSLRGAITRLHVRRDDGVELQAEAPSHLAAALVPGARVAVRFDERPALVTLPGSG